MNRPNFRLWSLSGVWIVMVSSALFAMADYGSIEGEAADPPAQWPLTPGDRLATETDKPTLVLFAHPLCPCTRATLWELESMTNRLYGLFNTHILFYRPEDTSSMPDIWAASDLKQMAQRLPGAQIHDDENGDIASLFGAYTSGQVLLYDSKGSLQFAGGITPTRGHTGSNAGQATVISAILNDENVDPLKAVLNPVYGCSLHGEKEGDLKLVPVVAMPL